MNNENELKPVGEALLIELVMELAKERGDQVAISFLSSELTESVKERLWHAYCTKEEE